jgi:hypothetical protein
MSSKIAAPAPHGKAGTRAVYVLARVRSSVVYILAGAAINPSSSRNPRPMLEELKLVVPEIMVLNLALGKSDAVDVVRHLVDLKFAGKILHISERDEIARDGNGRELRQPTTVRLTIIGPSTVRNTLAMAYGTATPSTGV